VKSKELLGTTLIAHHNLSFYLDLMTMMREAIEQRRFESFRQGFHASYSVEDRRGNFNIELEEGERESLKKNFDRQSKTRTKGSQKHQGRRRKR
jgi:hypothetical protein